MILRRKIYQELLKWKRESKGANALLVNGARRVGKSYICEQFGKNEYKTVLIVDFANISTTVRDIFENDRTNLDMFFAKLASDYDVELFKRNSLIVFDEVQLLPIARQMIKYLVADGRYDYIETGSLISIKLRAYALLLYTKDLMLKNVFEGNLQDMMPH